MSIYFYWGGFNKSNAIETKFVILLLTSSAIIGTMFALKSKTLEIMGVWSNAIFTEVLTQGKY